LRSLHLLECLTSLLGLLPLQERTLLLLLLLLLLEALHLLRCHLLLLSGLWSGCLNRLRSSLRRLTALTLFRGLLRALTLLMRVCHSGLRSHLSGMARLSWLALRTGLSLVTLLGVGMSHRQMLLLLLLLLLLLVLLLLLLLLHLLLMVLLSRVCLLLAQDHLLLH